MKKGWGRYATKNRREQKGYFRKYCDRSSRWKASQASCGDCLLKSGQKQEEIVHLGEKNESSREEDVGQTHQEGRQRIQESDQRRYETEETNTIKAEGEKVKKQASKEKKHEAKETKAYEKKEDRKESKSKKSR